MLAKSRIRATERLLQAVGGRGFKENFLTLFTGTSISQGLALLSMPLLTRLYDPDAFGRFGIYFALIAVLGTLCTGRMEMTIPLPKAIEEAKKLWRITFRIICILSVLSSLVLLAFVLFPKEDSHGIANLQFWAAVSIGIFIIALAEPLSQWHSRLKNFQILAFRNVAERVSLIIFSISFAFLPWNVEGLIWAQNIAIAFSVLFLMFTRYADRPYSEPLKAGEFKALFKKYKDFPLMQGWSAILMKLATQIPILIWSTRFSIEDTGQLNLAYRLIEAPVTLLASSFAMTYYQYTSQLSRPELGRAFIRSFRFKAIVLFPVFLIFGLNAPYLFQFIFGSGWKGAGQFAMPLAFLSYVKILYISQSVILLVLRRLDLEFRISLGFLLAQLAGFYGSSYFNLDAVTTVAIMSFLSCLLMITGIYVIFRQIFSEPPSSISSSAKESV